MKRTVQMAKRGIPARRDGRSATSPTFGHQRMPRTLGDVPIVLRSLVAIGGQRANCQWTKKRERQIRRAQGLA